jgi:hypothetical protein
LTERIFFAVEDGGAIENAGFDGPGAASSKHAVISTMRNARSPRGGQEQTGARHR